MGALIQLAAIGKQDNILTGNPQITFFKSVYRRYSNFSIESIQHSFNGTADFGQEFSADINSHGELMYKMYFQTDLPKINVSSGLDSGTSKYRAFRWLNWIGHILFEKLEIKIGSSDIDKHTGEWLHIWHELTCPEDKKRAYAEMVGNVPKLTQIYSTNSNNECIVNSHTLYVPLQFWFCRNPGLAFPLTAAKDNKCYLNLKLRDFNECIWACEQSAKNSYTSIKYGSDALGTQIKALQNTYLYIDYIFLGDDEKRKFKNNSHTYLIETLQTNGSETVNSLNTNIKLNFSHPVKELIWVAQPTNFISNDYSLSRGGRQYYNFTDLWDYNGFTGTPEPTNGCGMPGGRRPHNLFGGNPEVIVEGQLNKNNSWATTITSGSDTKIQYTNAGYVDIAQYTRTASINTFNNRNGIWNNTGNIRSDQGQNVVASGNLFIAGNARFTERKGSYFNLVQPYQHHTNIPAPGINVYSFALNPENNQPSGACNFSEIENSRLKLTLTSDSLDTNYNSGNVNINIYAVNYNILSVSNNKAVLAYAS